MYSISCTGIALRSGGAISGFASGMPFNNSNVLLVALAPKPRILIITWLFVPVISCSSTPAKFCKACVKLLLPVDNISSRVIILLAPAVNEGSVCLALTMTGGIRFLSLIMAALAGNENNANKYRCVYPWKPSATLVNNGVAGRSPGLYLIQSTSSHADTVTMLIGKLFTKFQGNYRCGGSVGFAFFNDAHRSSRYLLHRARQSMR